MRVITLVLGVAQRSMTRIMPVGRASSAGASIRVGVARLAQLHRLEAQPQALEGDGGSGARAVRSVRCRTRGFRADPDESRPRQEIAAEFSLTENGTAQLLLRARWALKSALDARV
jgi:hypothetical protein